MDLQTWVSIAVLLGTGATICTLMLHAIGKLDTKIDTVRDDLGGRIETVREELGGRIEASRAEFTSGMSDIRTEFTSGMSDMRAEFTSAIAASHADLKNEFNKVESRLTAIDSRIYDISTRLPAAPASASPA